MDCCRLLLLICLLVIFGCAEKDCEMSTVRVDGVDFPVKERALAEELKALLAEHYINANISPRGNAENNKKRG